MMCLGHQDKHSHDEWMTHWESERLWTYFSTTSPGRMTPEVLVACRVCGSAGRTSWCHYQRCAWVSQRCHKQTIDLNQLWVEAHSSVYPVTGVVRVRSSDSILRTATSIWLQCLCGIYHFSKSSVVLWLFLGFRNLWRIRVIWLIRIYRGSV